MHQRTILSALELLITLGLIYALCLSITYGQIEVSLKLIDLILCMSKSIKLEKQNQFTILEMFLALALLL